jgi:hypothetical protein
MRRRTRSGEQVRAPPRKKTSHTRNESGKEMNERIGALLATLRERLSHANQRRAFSRRSFPFSLRKDNGAGQVESNLLE